MTRGRTARCASLAALFAVSLTAAAPERAGADEPDLKLQDLKGHQVRLRDLRGSLLVLHFWATWCPPCGAEMPLLAAAHERYGPRGVAFLAASLDDRSTRKAVPAFVARQHLDLLPVYLGATADDLAAFDLGIAIPATAFIDRDGRVVARILGQVRDGEIAERLEWLLGDRSGPPPPALVTHL